MLLFPIFDNSRSLQSQFYLKHKVKRLTIIDFYKRVELLLKMHDRICGFHKIVKCTDYKIDLTDS